MHSLNHKNDCQSYYTNNILLRSRKNVQYSHSITMHNHTIVAHITLTMRFLRSQENIHNMPTTLICYEKRVK